jgi:hypothetical protein
MIGFDAYERFSRRLGGIHIFVSKLRVFVTYHIKLTLPR